MGNRESNIIWVISNNRVSVIFTELGYVFNIVQGLIDATLHTRDINKVDDTMDDIREQMDLANEISDAISQPVGFGLEMDEVRVVACVWV